MVSTLDDTKRMAIAAKLADMKALQELLIKNDEKLLSAVEDSEIRERFQDMLRDDQNNLKVLNDVTVSYGEQSEASETVQKMIQEVEHLMEGQELTLLDKVSQHELLKHKQAMSGILIHKAAQVVGADIEAAILPLNTVNFENRAHQEQLKGVIEVIGVRQLTGQEAKQGIWSRVQDAMMAATGAVGSMTGMNEDEMTIQNVIRMDHQKVNVLFMEIMQSDDSHKIQEYFGQLYKDLSVHAEAEEQTVYPTVRPFYGDDTQELYDEQAEMKQKLNKLKSMEPGSNEFKNEIKQLQDVVMDHVRQEESTMFGAIRNNCSEDQQKQLATEFKAAKQKLQQEMAK
ncbi:hemerythrin domain-containing protein [Chroococcus sp. FPU101]|uniref:hemerythrin domain-containing protein n=1 Tax=Chroococcus sp. FPU101 TaxID=1974212 RepID=UPI001A8D9BD0|nr:hemerythrin domain-containing protein [Chroococcus sp. FPU101]GFE70648.1 Hemerythrin HHE cation binding region [Chroococcus sp. FPU101]